MTQPAICESPTARYSPLLWLLVPAACLLWSYWTTFVELAGVWNSNPQYSHGFLVPVFAAILLYLRRDKLDLTALAPNIWGLGPIFVGLMIRLAGTFLSYDKADGLSLIPVIAGLTLLLGGRAAWRWAWPAVLFLCFMIPLPFSVETALAGPLQRLATICSTFVMQVLGLPALAEGNVILMQEQKINIVEACSGLRMLVVFFALSTAMILVVQRHWIDRTIILFSAIPIALAANITRITVTGLMYEAGWGEMASAFFHDVAGWLMMPLALAMLWLELKVLERLFVETPAPAATTRPAVTPTPRRTPVAPRGARPRRATPAVPPAEESLPVESSVKEG